MVNTKSKVVKRDQLHNAYCLCVHCVIDYRIYIYSKDDAPYWARTTSSIGESDICDMIEEKQMLI